MSKSISRRSFLRASALSAGAILGSGLLASCAPQQPAAEKEAVATFVAQSEEKIQLQYMHWGNEDEKNSTKAALDAFVAQNPNVTIEQLHVPDNYLEKITTMAASNTLPDGALFPESATIEWGLQDQFLDLTNIYTGEHEKVEAITYRLPNGQIVGVAGAQEIALLYYNKDFMKDQGVEVPVTTDSSWNWSDFLIITQQLTVDTSGRPASDPNFDPQNVDRYGFQMGLWDMPLYSFMRSNGGDFFSEDWLTMTLDKPENYEALQAIADLMNVQHVKPPFGVQGGIGEMNTSNAILSNKIGLVMDGQWALETMNKVRKEEGLNFGLGVIPYMKQPANTAVGGPIVAFKASKHPDEARALVGFIMDPHNTPEYIQGGLWMPNEKRWYTQPDLLSKWIDNENHPQEYKTVVVDSSMTVVSHPLPTFRVPKYNGLMDIVNPALEKVWLGDATAKEAIESILPQAKNHYEKNILPLLNG